MRFRFLAPAALLACSGFLAAAPARAALEDNLTSLGDAQVQGYLGPLVRGLSTSVNTGIFRSAGVPVAGFGLTLDLRAAYISFGDSDRTYTAETPGYETVDAPTVVGDESAVQAESETIPGVHYHYPGGFDMKNFGVAVPQLTVGNAAGTRAIIRWIPEINFSDEDIGSFKMFGLGGQHSISQYLPALPVDVAVGAMYQSFKLGDKLMDAKALAFNVMGSKRYGHTVSVEPYLGLGMDSFKMDVEYDDSNSDPVNISFDRENDFHVTVGTSINLPGVKLNGEFNKAAVTGFAGGISFGV
jgi:hypothetical protein